jgi:exosome complex RNA-binding protein Rrp42 (RNase PH superfamily)
MAAEDPVISLNEKQFLLESLSNNLRSDGRKLMDIRNINVNFERYDSKSVAEIQLGKTKVVSVVTAEVVAPLENRLDEGILRVNVDISPMASSSYESGRPTPLEIELTQILLRQIRESKAIDVESLCIVPAKSVLMIRIDVRIINDDGNLIDAASLAMMGSLFLYRKPHVDVKNGKIQMSSYQDHAPLPLTIFHFPLCVTFALCEYQRKRKPSFPIKLSVLDGESTKKPSKKTDTSDSDIDVSDDSVDAEKRDQGSWSARAQSDMIPETPNVASEENDEDEHSSEIVVLDPTSREELVCSSRITVLMNSFGDLCGLHKLGGVAVDPDTIMLCVKRASEKVNILTKWIKTEGKLADERFILLEARKREAHELISTSVRFQGRELSFQSNTQLDEKMNTVKMSEAELERVVEEQARDGLAPDTVRKVDEAFFRALKEGGQVDLGDPIFGADLPSEIIDDQAI